MMVNSNFLCATVTTFFSRHGISTGGWTFHTHLFKCKKEGILRFETTFSAKFHSISLLALMMFFSTMFILSLKMRPSIHTAAAGQVQPDAQADARADDHPIPQNHYISISKGQGKIFTNILVCYYF